MRKSNLVPVVWKLGLLTSTEEVRHICWERKVLKTISGPVKDKEIRKKGGKNEFIWRTIYCVTYKIVAVTLAGPLAQNGTVKGSQWNVWELPGDDSGYEEVSGCGGYMIVIIWNRIGLDNGEEEENGD